MESREEKATPIPRIYGSLEQKLCNITILGGASSAIYITGGQSKHIFLIVYMTCALFRLSVEKR